MRLRLLEVGERAGDRKICKKMDRYAEWAQLSRENNEKFHSPPPPRLAIKLITEKILVGSFKILDS